MEDLSKYYQSCLQEIVARQISNEDGATQEQTFTNYVLEILSEVGETENAKTAYDEKALGTRNQHKINAYAIADNYETVDLFISIYNPENELYSVPKSEVDRAVTRISNFFRKAIYNDYAGSVAESSEIFTFANTLATYKELKDALVRINAFILTNGEYKGEIPESIEICGYKFFFRIIDVKYLYQIAVECRVPIEIDFKEENFKVPCLSAESENSDYQAYIAILPGTVLANLYERYGARLLEQNVRSFLQFTGKINKGIRDTIKNEPHMFLAFNNGLAATADNIEIDNITECINKISNLQIVNGGQTTASIYHTYKKDKADISKIFVQVKISVIKRMDEYSNIVSRISRYANTQNKVNDADFTANNPFLVAFEKLSRFFAAPTTELSNIPTYWFFERARGQYKNLSQKEGFTKSRKATFDLKYPKRQVITKVELAKYINAYQEVYDGKKLVIGPHIVVRGNEKNFARFINDNLPNSLKAMNNIYFEDVIAKAILFKSVDKLYGTKKSERSIGELKQVVVPYAISLLYLLTKGRLDLYKIWKNQSISENLSDFMYKLMLDINQYIISESPSSHYIEWSKKEECWSKIKNHNWTCNLEEIQTDLCVADSSINRKIVPLNMDNSEDLEYELGIINSIPWKLWQKIAEWGEDTGCLSINYQNAAIEIARNIRFKHKLTAGSISRAMNIFEIICDKNVDLLMEADELMEEQQKEELIAKQKELTDSSADEINIEMIRKMVEWDRRKRILEDWKWKLMDKIVKGERPLDAKIKKALIYNLSALRKKGFPE